MCMTMVTCFDTFNSILSYDGKYCMYVFVENFNKISDTTNNKCGFFQSMGYSVDCAHVIQIYLFVVSKIHICCIMIFWIWGAFSSVLVVSINVCCRIYPIMACRNYKDIICQIHIILKFHLLLCEIVAESSRFKLTIYLAASKLWEIVAPKKNVVESFLKSNDSLVQKQYRNRQLLYESF